MPKNSQEDTYIPNKTQRVEVFRQTRISLLTKAYLLGKRLGVDIYLKFKDPNLNIWEFRYDPCWVQNPEQRFAHQTDPSVFYLTDLDVRLNSH